MTIHNKREREKKIVYDMIALYCKKNHKITKGLCLQCDSLYNYAWERIEQCPMMESKTFCSSCTVHCYSPRMRTEIRQVMRFSGPRMIFYHPVTAIQHMIDMGKEKLQQRLGDKKRTESTESQDEGLMKK